MKMRKAHIVPLSRQAIELLGLAAQGQDRRRRLPEPGRPEANVACAMLAGHQGRDGQRRDQSWFRNHVRSWCAAHGVDRQVAELAIAHTAGGVEGRYQRDLMIERGRPVMQAWADYLIPVNEAANVVKPKRERA
jgi:hypothetical protein